MWKRIRYLWKYYFSPTLRNVSLDSKESYRLRAEKLEEDSRKEEHTMGDEVNLEQIREQCGEWNEDLETCDDDFPEGCPYQAECKKEAEED